MVVSIKVHVLVNYISFQLIAAHLGPEESHHGESKGLTCYIQLQNIPPTVVPSAVHSYGGSPHPSLLQGVCKAQGEADEEIKVYGCCPRHLFVWLFTAHLVTVTAPERLWSGAHPLGSKRTFLLNLRRFFKFLQVYSSSIPNPSPTASQYPRQTPAQGFLGAKNHPWFSCI